MCVPTDFRPLGPGLYHKPIAPEVHVSSSGSGSAHERLCLAPHGKSSGAGEPNIAVSAASNAGLPTTTTTVATAK